ncbi:MAG: malate dehydrogenase, partial [Candidatus Bathyarchaeota archaeon B23]
MGHHIAVVGTGRVGRPTAYTLLCEGLAEELSLVDVKPGLAWAFGEELKHAATSLKLDVEINAYERDEEVSGADLVVVTAGKPRIPGVKMSRRDLVPENARTIAYIAEVMPPRNRGARWVVVSNPVDAMATLFKRVSGESYVISTGDHADTLRFRAKLAMELAVPYSRVEGYVGGEHGKAAYPLWSTVRIGGQPLEEYLASTGKTLDRGAVVEYLRGVSKRIVDTIGGTEYGPASAFRDIVRSILQDRREVYSVAVSRRMPGIPEEVNVNVPIHVGQSLGPDLWSELTDEEQGALVEAARAI